MNQTRTPSNHPKSVHFPQKRITHIKITSPPIVEREHSATAMPNTQFTSKCKIVSACTTCLTTIRPMFYSETMGHLRITQVLTLGLQDKKREQNSVCKCLENGNAQLYFICKIKHQQYKTLPESFKNYIPKKKRVEQQLHKLGIAHRFSAGNSEIEK
ncbi:unnamed protein product [Dovyalis caffra]|uniref:Uncharacterized protein n=1 Tax=Dovyalis caffra TaxID=77055 RepID=A0AAV1S381_9ROSI|nr:unnamed protein product [Dovyalis caffra]